VTVRSSLIYYKLRSLDQLIIAKKLLERYAGTKEIFAQELSKVGIEISSDKVLLYKPKLNGPLAEAYKELKV